MEVASAYELNDTPGQDYWNREEQGVVSGAVVFAAIRVGGDEADGFEMRDGEEGADEILPISHVLVGVFGGDVGRHAGVAHDPGNRNLYRREGLKPGGENRLEESHPGFAVVDDEVVGRIQDVDRLRVSKKMLVSEYIDQVNNVHLPTRHQQSQRSRIPRPSCR